ncbi:hypothetical protein QZH41_013483, partial [Actinostola sp. cb2023]
MQAKAIIVLIACVSQVNGKFHCVGTCYSGRIFPKPEDIVHGKHLKGHSYKNITTDDPKKCYSFCVNDCRKACQMKSARCELLDEDKTSKADDFGPESRYVYYDLKQVFYKGPCMNGGTCVEHCHTPKQKFTCNCTQPFTGKICKQMVYESCVDVLKGARIGTTPPNGNYTIKQDTYLYKTVYCDFNSPNQAWTLFESFSLAMNTEFFKVKAFHQDAKRNDEAPNWKNYRMGYSTMKYIRDKATMFRATCDFPKRVGSLTSDYLLGYLRDYDIISHGDVTKGCFKMAHMNLRGYEYYN